MIFEDINSVCRVVEYDADNSHFISQNNYAIPVGQNIVAFGVSKAGDDYEAAFIPFTVTPDVVVPMELNPMSLENIHAQLQSY